LTAHVENVSDADHFGEMHVADGVCVGIAPVGDNLWNLTIVALAQRHGRAIAADPMRFFVRTLTCFPELESRIASATIAGEPLARVAEANREVSRTALLPSGPFDIATGRIVTDGIALTGDAAGYYDPFTGQGIFQALRSAEFLAEEVGTALRKGSSLAVQLRTYERRHKRLVGEARVLQRAIESVLARPRIADAAIRRLARRPAVSRALLAATGDLKPASSLLSPALLLSFGAPHLRRAPA
jgi:flavin-dependent dehydrogenase